jgi:hypothetical protein
MSSISRSILLASLSDTLSNEADHKKLLQHMRRAYLSVSLPPLTYIVGSVMKLRLLQSNGTETGAGDWRDFCIS